MPFTPVHFLRFVAPLGALLGATAPVLADPRVAVVATAREDYVERKFGAGGTPRTETYVFMQGHYFGGQTVDRSIERMPFRRIAEYLAPELAKQRYEPTTQVGEADLLLVVHWGTTVPYTGTQEMMGRNTVLTDTSTSADTFNQTTRQQLVDTLTGNLDPQAQGDSPFAVQGMTRDAIESYATLSTLNMRDSTETQRISDRLNQLTDHISKDTSKGSNMTLLGYNETMHRLGKQMWTDATERILSYDLEDERYFIIVNAYDLKDKAGGSARPVWKMHLNISSPGNNFRTALDRMSLVAGNYAGRTTGTVVSIRPTTREGKVTLAPMVILGEVKPPSK